MNSNNFNKSKYTFPDKDKAVRCEDLPDPFLRQDKTRLSSPEQWQEHREYLKEMLAHYVYGHMPPPPEKVDGKVVKSVSCYNGKAIRETVELSWGRADREDKLHLTLEILRPNVDRKVPVFVWNQFTDMTPCPIEEQISGAGYAIAMFDRTQLAKDTQGMEAPFEEEICPSFYPEYDWRAIGVWGWGHSVVASYLIDTDYADSDRLIATGFSRGGKAALCAAIYDDRFALCAAAGSGCLGAASLRFMGGRLGNNIGKCESLGDITKKDRFWYWFSDNCAEYGNHAAVSALKDESLLPFDLHFIRGLIAPRPLITVDGLDDIWSNPYGIQISWTASNEIYDFLGKPEHNAMRFREGGHAFNSSDWSAVLAFCENTLLGKGVECDYKLPSEDDEAMPRVHFGWKRP